MPRLQGALQVCKQCARRGMLWDCEARANDWVYCGPCLPISVVFSLDLGAGAAQPHRLHPLFTSS